MPRELVTVQVGQCGNQIGCRFWDIALKEHASMCTSNSPVFDEPLSSFFRNEDVRTKRNLGIGSPISGLKARAVLIDTECGVLNSLMAGPLGDIFERRQLISDQVSFGLLRFSPSCAALCIALLLTLFLPLALLSIAHARKIAHVCLIGCVHVCACGLRVAVWGGQQLGTRAYGVWAQVP
jgi:hypothetical protein